MEAMQKDRRYTYADYCTWDDDTRWELIEGVPYAMAPSPSLSHQSLSGSIHNQLYNFLVGNPCRVFAAPFDVRLNAAGDDDDTVVQPDIVVVCDREKLDEKGCNGAPDMVVEILSPSSDRHDRFVKFRLYRSAGVREYWIVDPNSRTIQACLLKGSEYIINVYSDEAPVSILNGCSINLRDVLDEFDSETKSLVD